MQELVVSCLVVSEGQRFYSETWDCVCISSGIVWLQPQPSWLWSGCRAKNEVGSRGHSNMDVDIVRCNDILIKGGLFILNFTSLVWPNCYRFTSHSSLVNWNTLFTEFIWNNRTCLCMCNLPNYNGCGAAMFAQYFASSKFSLILVLVILGRPDNCHYYHLAVNKTDVFYLI